MPVVTGVPLAKTKMYLGIDPGSAGGFAAVTENGDCLLWPAAEFPTERDLWEWFQCRRPSLIAEVTAVIEKVGGYMPGSAGNIGSAMFKFGQNFGMLRAFLCAAGIPYEEVTPAAWQKALGIPTRKKTETKSQQKNKLKAAAQRLFPQEKVTLATADALLLAEFCRRKKEGRL